MTELNVAPTTVTGGEAVVAALIDHGVRHVFGIPGAQTYELYDALHQHADVIRTIGVRHEQAAGYMAFGYAQASGHVGVCSVVPGPGVLNASAALATANACGAPVLCLAGQIPSPAIGGGRGVLHELPDQLSLLRGVTRWAERATSPDHAATLVSNAIDAMTTGRGGAAAIELPWDVMNARGSVSRTEAAAAVRRPSVPSGSIDAAAALLAAATRPMIWVGSGALGACAEVQALATLLGAPVASFRGGRGIMPDDDPLALTTASAWHLWSRTDVLLAVGTRAEPPLMHWPADAGRPWVIRVDIDPLEYARVPSQLGLVGDAATTLRSLIDELGRRPHGAYPRTEIAAAQALAARELAELQPQHAYLTAIREVLPRDGCFVEEYCQAGYTAWSGFPIYEPRTFIRGGYFGNLGFGYATALGAKVAHPARAVVSISGDGGFQYTLPELATAAEHGIGVVAVVFNNGGYGNVRRDQRTGFDGRLLGADLVNPDFVRVADAYGVAAERATTPAALRAALDRAFSAGGPALIEVPVPRDSEAPPWQLALRRAPGAAR